MHDRTQRIMDVPFVLDLGIATESISPDGEVVCTRDVSDKINVMGGTYGGAIKSLADQAFSIACNLGSEPTGPTFHLFLFLTGMTISLEKGLMAWAMVALGQWGFRHPTLFARSPNGQKDHFSHRFNTAPGKGYGGDRLQCFPTIPRRTIPVKSLPTY